MHRAQMETDAFPNHPQFHPLNGILKTTPRFPTGCPARSDFTYLWNMDDLRFWVWIIILVGYYIIRARNKAKKEAEARRVNQPLPEQTAEEASSGRPMTFEDLLREIQTGKSPAKPAPAPLPPPQLNRKPEPSPWEVDYEDAPVEEIQDLETIPQRPDPLEQSYNAYEKAKQQAFNHISLEETMQLSDTDVKFGHFKGYDAPVQRSVLADYLLELKDPEGFRKAFVMSEILKRKF
jgi:hypothetical protein